MSRDWGARLRVAILVLVSFWALSLLDITRLLAAGATLSGSALLLIFGVCSFWALVGGLVALAVEHLWRFCSRLPERVRVALLGAVLAVVPLALLASLALTGLPSLAGATRWAFITVTAAGISLACGFLAWLVLRRGESSLSPTVGIGLLAVALGAFVADATVLVRLYPEAHYGLAYVALLCVSAPLIRTRFLDRLIEKPWATAGLPLVTLVLVVAASLRQFPASDYAVLFESSNFSGKLMTISRNLVDLDRDGHSAVLGGGDCQDRNPSVNPAMVDIPENGLDEDCSDGDLTLAKLLAVRGTAPAAATERMVRPTHVFLFTMDTLRADHLGAYGYERNTSTNIDAMARDAVVFERAFSQSNNTASSFPALMTGRYPSASPWSFDPAVQHSRGWPFLHDENNLTLAEVLAAAGFRTAAIMRGSVALATGLDQGLQRKVLNPADLVFAFAQVLDESAGAPLFAWLHLDNPHDPYSPRALPFGSSPMEAYDAEILEADSVIGGALAEIRKRGLWETSLLALTSDHGEEFGEHGGRFHASTLYNEQIHVPLIVRFPGRPGGRVARNVQSIDLMPTIAESVGQPLAMVDGQSLLRDVPFEESIAYSEQYDGSVRRRALVKGRHKLIQKISSNVLELYDLSVDPKEKENLIDVQPLEGQRLRSMMDSIASHHDLLLVALSARGDRQGMERLAENVHQISQPVLRQHAIEMMASEIARGTISVATLSKMVRQSTLPEALRDAVLDAAERLDPEARDELLRAARRREPKAASVPKDTRRELRGSELQLTETGRVLIVEFDGSRGEAALQGFGGSEKNGARTVRWGTEKRSAIMFEYAGAPRELSLSLEARAISSASSDIDVRITCNGHAVGTLGVGKAWTIRGAQIPAHSVRSGENMLEFSYSETVEPAKINAGSKDVRRLSLLYDWLVVATISDRAEVDLRSAVSGIRGLSGFHDMEGSGDGAFRWSRDRRSEVELFLAPAEKRDYELTLDASAFHPIAPIGVRVLVNDAQVAKVDVSEQKHPQRIVIPSRHLARVMRIAFEYDKTAQPAAVLPSSRDTRDISLRWSGLELAPRGDERKQTTQESSISLPPRL